MKKWTNVFIAMILVFSLSTPTFAASKSGRYSGTPSTSSIHTPTTTTPGSSSGSNVYRSGVQRPSNQVTNSGTQGTYNNQQPSTSTYTPSTNTSRSGIGSFLGGMAVGGILGSMFHPFSSGYNGYGREYGLSSGFSFTGILLDIALIVGAVWLFRKLRRRA
ncbi:MAG TPA: hypothetical protein VJ824_07910 [Bacillota bacterium]|nr:hypothetical protein [Bacillota bacterium]